MCCAWYLYDPTSWRDDVLRRALRSAGCSSDVVEVSGVEVEEGSGEGYINEEGNRECDVDVESR